MYEDNYEYASRRLNQTVVRTAKGDPFFVDTTEKSDTDIMVHSGVNLVTEKTETHAHVSLNLEPVPLGFINTKFGMLFVSRKPLRRDYKQGLALSNLNFHGEAHGHGQFKYSLLCQPILLQYPSFEEALINKDKKKERAFSRDFGIYWEDEKPYLQFRCYTVGKIVNEKCKLNFDKLFLQQHLEESGGII